MPSKLSHLSLLCAAVALLVAPACGSSFGENSLAQLSITVENESDPSEYFLPDVAIGIGGSTVQIVVKNIGSDDLIIDDIFIRDGGNPYIQLNWTSGEPVFPETLATGDLFAEIRFRIKYEPAEPASLLDSELVIVSNDSDGREHVITFRPPQKVPRVNVNPKLYTYLNATAASPETQTFEITNEGGGDLIISAVRFAAPTGEFTITRQPAPNAVVPPPAVSPTAKETFDVRYQPQDDVEGDQAVIIVETNDPREPQVNIRLSSKTIPGRLVVTHQDMVRGFVDFQDVQNAGTVVDKVINLFNEGPGNLRVVNLETRPDDGAGAYALLVQRPGEDPVAYNRNDVVSIRAEASVDVIARYTSPGPQGVDRDLVVEYRNPFEAKAVIPMKGGAPKPELVVYPTAQAAASRLQYHSDGGTRSRTMVLANEGTAGVTVRGLELSLPPGFEGTSMEFELVGAPAGEFVIPGLGLQPVDVRFLAGSDAVINKANLTVTYVDASGQDSTWNVALNGYNQPGADIDLPVANPGMPSDYAGAVVGSEVQLSGVGSTPGVDANLLPTGYTWYLSEKPVGSASELNLTTGANTSFIPDQPGSYTIILLVQSDRVETGEGTKFGPVDYVNLWSDEAKVEIQVAPAP